MDELTPPLPGLSPVLDKDIVARFDGESISSDGGLLVLREVQRRSGLPARLAACLDDPRDPGRIHHTLADMIAFRTLMIAAGYEDANDAGALTHRSYTQQRDGTSSLNHVIVRESTGAYGG